MELNNICNIYNHYSQAVITYTFGDETEVLDWNTIQNWLTIVDGNGVLDENQIWEYVAGWRQNIMYDLSRQNVSTSLGTDCDHSRYGE